MDHATHYCILSNDSVEVASGIVECINHVPSHQLVADKACVDIATRSLLADLQLLLQQQVVPSIHHSTIRIRFIYLVTADISAELWHQRLGVHHYLQLTGAFSDTVFGFVQSIVDVSS